MGKYNYKIYDYSLAGIRKKDVYCMKQITDYEWDALKKYFKPEEVIYRIKEDFKNNWYKRNEVDRINPNVLFHFVISTSERSYEFDETGCEKEKSRC
jgi:hypothetical protein